MKTKEAYEHIKIACDKRLEKLYPQGIPEIVASRYAKELAYLKDSEYLEDFEIFRLLSAEARKSAQFLFLRGTDMSSYILYLLGDSKMNPLPAHYYCPSCGHFEVIDTSLFGLDLPENTCPKCNEAMQGDGFRLPIESAWGLDGKKMMSFEYCVGEEFLPFAKRVLEKQYPDNVIVPLGYLNKNRDEEVITMQQSGFLILPIGHTIEDYAEMHGYLENGDLCLTGNALDMEEHNLRRIVLYSFDAENNLVIMQRKTGIFINDISLQELSSITWSDLISTTVLSETENTMYKTLKPKSFTDMVSICGCAHDAFENIGFVAHNNSGKLLQLMEEETFAKFPCFTREDVYDSALALGLNNKDAFELSELVRKGKIARSPELLDKYDLPDAFQKVAKECLYLFSRAHCVSFILVYAMLAYYMKKDSRSYSRLVYKK